MTGAREGKGANRPFITADGCVSPCCWTATSLEEDKVYGLANLDPGRYSIHARPLPEILSEEPFLTLFDKAWLTGGNATCTKKCGDRIRNHRFALIRRAQTLSDKSVQTAA